MRKGTRTLRAALRKVDEVAQPPLPYRRGHPFVYVPRPMLKAFFVMTVKKIKTSVGLWRFLDNNVPIRKACGFGNKLPHWRTFDRRFASFGKEAEHQLRACGNFAVQQGHITAEVVSADKSLHQAQGPLWHKKHREAGIIPDKLRHVDVDSAWGFSPYRKWVQGYAQCTLVNATPGEARFPLDVTAEKANVPENHLFCQRISFLPSTVKKVLLDGTYDDDEVFLVCHQRRVRPVVHMESPGDAASPIRQWAWKINQQKVNRRLYAKRRETIEPSFGNGKRSFENQKVWFYGLLKNKTHLVMTHFVRAVVMLINFETGHPPENIQERLDAWQ